jgi:hypothetical protein
MIWMLWMRLERQKRRVRLRLGGDSVKQPGRGSVLRQKLSGGNASWNGERQSNNGSKSESSVALVANIRTLWRQLPERCTNPSRTHHRSHSMGGGRGHDKNHQTNHQTRTLHSVRADQIEFERQNQRQNLMCHALLVKCAA